MRRASPSIDEQGHERDLQRIHDAGLFEGRLAQRLATLSRARALRRTPGRDRRPLSLPADPVRFRSLSARRRHAYASLREARRTSHGARRRAGVAFAVFAPIAKRVSVVGDFNFWDGRRHAMRVRGNGFWEIFVPGARRRRQIQIRDHRAGRPPAAVEIRSASHSRPSCGRRPLRSWSTWTRSRARSLLPPGVNALRRADLDLRSASRLVAAASARRRPLAELPRAGRGAAGLCARHGLHACRIPAGQRASVRRLLGLSADRTVRADQPLRHTRRFRGLGRCLPPRRTCRDSRLGARTFPGRSAWPRQFDGTALYEHANPKQGRHLDWNTLIYNYGTHRGRQFPARQRLVLARSLPHRRPARRCGRLHALPRLQPARRRLDPEQIRRARESRSHQLPAPLQHRAVLAISQGDHGGRGVRPPGPWCRGRSIGAGSASATNGTWDGCTTRSNTSARIRSTASIITARSCSVCTTRSSRTSSCRSRMTRSCTASARFSAACPATSGSASPICAPITASCSAIPARSSCSWATSSPRKTNGAMTTRSTGTCSISPRHAGIQALVRDLNRLYRTVPALHELDCDGAGLRMAGHARCRPQRVRLAAQGAPRPRSAAWWW